MGCPCGFKHCKARGACGHALHVAKHHMWSHGMDLHEASIKHCNAYGTYMWPHVVTCMGRPLVDSCIAKHGGHVNVWHISMGCPCTHAPIYAPMIHPCMQPPMYLCTSVPPHACTACIHPCSLPPSHATRHAPTHAPPFACTGRCSLPCNLACTCLTCPCTLHTLQAHLQPACQSLVTS